MENHEGIVLFIEVETDSAVANEGDDDVIDREDYVFSQRTWTPQISFQKLSDCL